MATLGYPICSLPRNHRDFKKPLEHWLLQLPHPWKAILPCPSGKPLLPCISLKPYATGQACCEPDWNSSTPCKGPLRTKSVFARLCKMRQNSIAFATIGSPANCCWNAQHARPARQGSTKRNIRLHYLKKYRQNGTLASSTFAACLSISISLPTKATVTLLGAQVSAALNSSGTESFHQYEAMHSARALGMSPKTLNNLG